MSTQRLENQQLPESSDRSCGSNAAFHQQLSSNLYTDLSIFRSNNQSDKHCLPGLQIAGVGDQAMSNALQGKNSPAEKAAAGQKTFAKDDNSFEAWDSWMKDRGLEQNRALESGHMKVYTPKDGQQTDQFGCTKVEIFSHDRSKSIYARTSHFANGDKTTESFDGSTGKREYRTEFDAATGQRLTTFDGADGNADTMKKAYDQNGATGLKAEIDRILKQKDGNWSKVDTMLKELGERGVETYWSGDRLYINNFDFGTGLRDSHVADKPAEPVSPPPAAQEKPEGRLPKAEDWRRFHEVLQGHNK